MMLFRIDTVYTVVPVFVPHASHRHRLATVRTVTGARVDPVEMAEEEHGCTRRAGVHFDRTPILPDAHEEIEFVHQLWQLVNRIIIYIIIVILIRSYVVKLSYLQYLQNPVAPNELFLGGGDEGQSIVSR